MAISSVGIGSGLDVESLVTQMVELERRPIKTLEAKAEFIDAKISVQGQIKSMVSDLHAALFDLTLEGTWKTAKASTSGSSVSATISGSAAVGSYNMNVTQLAQSQTMVSAKLGATDKLGAGTFKFTVGNLTQTTHEVELSGSETLTEVAQKINNGNFGVAASVIQGSDGKQQLVLTAKNTGLDGQFKLDITANPDAATPIADDWLGSYAPDAAEGAPGATGFAMAQQAKNARLTLNGVALESSTNNFNSALTGVNITVTGTGTSLLNVTNDTAAIKEKVMKFVDAYNSLNELLTASTKYTEDTKTAGVFQGDSSIVSMQNAFRMLTQNVASQAQGAFKRLADIGISIANPTTAKVSGELVVDASKLNTALNDLESMQGLFATKSSNASSDGVGIAVAFRNFTSGLLDLEGALKTKEDSLSKELKRNASEVEKVETRAETVEARLRKQYSALDVKMASLGSLSSYVEQMVASWNKSKD